MLATTPGDGDSQTCRISRITGWTLARRLPVLFGVQSPYEVTVLDAKENREATVHLEGKELPRLQEAARAKFPQDQRSETAGEFKLKDDGKIAVMKINGFGGFVDRARRKSLREFYRESFKAINKSGTKSRSSSTCGITAAARTSWASYCFLISWTSRSSIMTTS